MPLTHHPHGVSSFGVPLITHGIPPGANVFFVSTSGGNANSGLDPDEAVATITKALTFCVASKGDTIIVLPGTYTENVVVNVQGVRIIGYSNGLGGPYMTRINPASATSSTATILVQARDVEIAGLQVAGNHDAGYNTPAIFVDGDNSGTRSYIHDCTIENLTPTATAYSTGIKLYGDRHTIERCLVDSCDIGIHVDSSVQATYEITIKDCILRANNIGIYVDSAQPSTGQHCVTIDDCIMDAAGAYSQTYGVLSDVAAGSGVLTTNCRIANYTTGISGGDAILNYNQTIGGTLLTA